MRKGKNRKIDEDAGESFIDILRTARYQENRGEPAKIQNFIAKCGENY